MSLLVKPEHNKNNNNNKIHKWKRLHFITGKPNNLLFWGEMRFVGGGEECFLEEFTEKNKFKNKLYFTLTLMWHDEHIKLNFILLIFEEIFLRLWLRQK